jgi:subtilase family serine protease
MNKKGLIGLIVGILGTSLILSVATKTTKIARIGKAVKAIDKVYEYQLSPSKILSRSTNIRDINSAKENNEKFKTDRERSNQRLDWP